MGCRGLLPAMGARRLCLLRGRGQRSNLVGSRGHQGLVGWAAMEAGVAGRLEEVALEESEVGVKG